MRALRPTAASVRELSGHRRSFRPLLRLLRPRARARPGPTDLVAAVAAGCARASGGGADRRHLVGVYAPGQVAQPRESRGGKGLGRGSGGRACREIRLPTQWGGRREAPGGETRARKKSWEKGVCSGPRGIARLPATRGGRPAREASTPGGETRVRTMLGRGSRGCSTEANCASPCGVVKFAN